jgi:hypothetical protein
MRCRAISVRTTESIRSSAGCWAMAMVGIATIRMVVTID